MKYLIHIKAAIVKPFLYCPI